MSSTDDWKVEYQQLSEDFRFFIQMGWQATVAVLAADGLLVGTVLSVHPSRWLGFVPFVGAALTFLMAGETLKWDKRFKSRLLRLQQYDRLHNFGRFYVNEQGFRTWPLGHVLRMLMFAVGIGLTAYALTLFLCTPAFCPCPDL
jgi:hypothetical protein